MGATDHQDRKEPSPRARSRSPLGTTAVVLGIVAFGTLPVVLGLAGLTAGAIGWARGEPRGRFGTYVAGGGLIGGLFLGAVTGALVDSPDRDLDAERAELVDTWAAHEGGERECLLDAFADLETAEAIRELADLARGGADGGVIEIDAEAGEALVTAAEC